MWNWEYLTIQNFQWIYGSTPMSDVSVIYTSWVVYFIGILSIRWYMAERTRIEKSHKGVLFYNASMILCSTCVWCLSSWFLWQLIHANTFCHAPEHPLFNTHGKYMLYSMYLCYLLRFYAFLDTVILALRKKSIPFLHWYQHMFVILMMWSWLQDQSIFGSLAISIISFVQIFRYCYFFTSGLDMRYAFWIKNMAFLLEIVQFLAGIVLTAYQVSVCPQSNCVLLSASINVTMVYMAVKYYDSNEKAVATTRDKRRNKIKE